MKVLVILPTFNERDNLPVVVRRVLGHDGFDVLVVDDSSTDGTLEFARRKAGEEPRVNLIERPSKLGLGTAYITGFKWGIERGYDCMIEMDSDLSHDPSDLPKLVGGIEIGNALVIGSRYIGGTISVLGWDFRRLLLSRFGNIYASWILKIPLTDMTSGFRAYSAQALKTLNLDGVRSEGYAFQIEMAYLVWESGRPVTEIPIVFTERTSGISKMSRKIVKEAVWLPWRLRLRRLVRGVRRAAGISAESRTRQSK